VTLAHQPPKIARANGIDIATRSLAIRCGTLLLIMGLAPR